MSKKKVIKKQDKKKDKIFYIGIFLSLSIISLLVYWNSFFSPFIWDDKYTILENHYVKSFKYLPEIFKHHLYYSTAGISNFYRPLQTFFLMIDYKIWKTNPIGYHLTSFIFHLLTGFISFLIINSLFNKKIISFLVSLLFLIHPINSTVVDYISSRADSQATFFFLLSFFLFLKYIFRKNILFYISSIISFIMSLLSKELAIILPFFILFYLYYEKKDYKKSIPFFIIFFIYGILRLTVLKFISPPSQPPNLYLRLLTTTHSFIKLIGLMFLPLQIHIEKTLPYSKSLFEVETFLSVVVFVIIGICIYLLLKKNFKISFFGFLWFFICLLPMANIVPINTTLADHWLYLPGIGFILGIIGFVYEGIQKLKSKFQDIVKKLFLYIYVLVIIIFSFLTVKQNTIWKDPINFYQLALKYNPGSFRAHNELGVIYLENNELEKAIFHFEKAISLNENFDQAYDNLGIAYDKSGKPEKSIACYEKALKLNPYSPKTYNNLGNAYTNLNQFDKAIETYKKAIKLNPQYKAIYNNLGVVYYKKGILKEAIKYWEKTLEIDPNFELARKNLEVVKKIHYDEK